MSNGKVPDPATASHTSPSAAALETVAALRESEAKYRAMIQAFDGHIYICSEDCRIEFMNDPLIRRTGRDATGEHCYQALHGITEKCSWCVNDRVFAGEKVRWEVKSPKDGRWYEVSNSPLRRPDGSVSKMSLIVDITEKKEAEEALRHSEAQYRALFENSMDAVFLSPSDGMISAANPAACAMFNMTEEELCAVGRAGLVDPSDLRVKAAVAERAAKGTMRREMRFRRKDGTPFLAEATSVFIGDAGNSFVIVRDVSEQHRAKEEIISLNATLERRVKDRTKELEFAIREQESFSHSVSHDLRAPLRHINSYCTILEEDCQGKIPAEAQGYLKKIKQATVRMGGLIDHLLDLARVSRTEITLEKVDLTAMATEIANMLVGAEQQACREMVIEQGLVAHGDRILFRQLLQNLLDNACKYSAGKPNARVEFGRIAIGGKWHFFVKDNGVGFDMTYSDKLFKIFQRLHGPEFQGNGIGLAIVQRILHRHGGSIWASGAPDEGATFYFTLPPPPD